MQTRLDSVMGNSQRLDGGAMFGNAPKALWTRWAEPDNQNRIPLACRALLVREGAKTILLETGIGAFFEPRLRERFGVVEERHVLLENLASLGLSHEDIDVIVLSHLHFDHAGGLLSAFQEDEAPRLLFPNATYIVGKEAWQRANHPHPRDRASYIGDLQPLLEQSGRLEIIEGEHSSTLGPNFRFHRSHGHTPGLLLTEINTSFGPLVFAADLIPGAPWVHVPITMGYDRWPEKLIDEKQALLADLESRNGWLFFTHDPHVAMGRVERDEKNRYRVTDTHSTLENHPASEDR
ncbi:MAG: MBL fold metallo-hydrolase [Myxococcota bacterium]|nr:MBL fold metallo-hydrolase [Myxococcota bacterium]